MAMAINKLQRNTGNKDYYTKAFRIAIEDHLSLIRSNGIVEVRTLTARQIEKFTMDFYGLLIEFGIQEEYHWITLRVNNLHSPADFIGSETPILIVSPQLIKNILAKHLSSSSAL